MQTAFESPVPVNRNRDTQIGAWLDEDVMTPAYPGQPPARGSPSYSDFDDPASVWNRSSAHVNREAPFDRFVQVGKQFLERLPLGGAPGDGRYLRPVAPSSASWTTTAGFI